MSCNNQVLLRVASRCTPFLHPPKKTFFPFSLAKERICLDIERRALRFVLKAARVFSIFISRLERES